MARRRRRRYTLDPCKVSIPRLRRLSEKALGKIWGTLHHRRDKGLQTLGNIAINLAAAKSSARMYTGKQRRHAVYVYMHAVRLGRDRLAEVCAVRAKKALVPR